MRSPTMKPSLVCRVLLASGLFLTACGRSGDNVAITETREISSYAPKAHVDIPSARRFFDDAREEEEEQPRPNFRELLTWSVPEGWSESQTPDPMGMRLIDFRFGPNQEGECYISLIPGAAGGLEANVNRWRGQMGQPPYTPEEIEKLPTKPFFNREATFVAFDGDFRGFGAEEAQKGYRMLGLIHSAEQATIFVKLTGPKELAEQNAAAFDAFCQSIKPKLPQQ